MAFCEIIKEINTQIDQLLYQGRESISIYLEKR